MNIPLALAFLFSVGAELGWCIEFLFRNLISHKGPRGKYFINPGFCQGPYLPIYGIGLTLMFVISGIVTEKLAGKAPVLVTLGVIVVMMILMTLLEVIGGSFLLDKLNLRLWDYRNEWGNWRGITCPRFTCIWGILGGAYYLLLHPMVQGWLEEFSRNLAFSFWVGLFFGVFILDAVHSTKMLLEMREFSRENKVVVRYETLKSHIRKRHDEARSKYNFFRPFNGPDSLREHMKQAKDEFEKRVPKVRKKKTA